jgi:hypothetical protein
MAVTYEPIATSSPSSVSTVTFSSLGTYTDIKIIIGGLTTASPGYIPFLRFNSDSGFNYSTTIIYGSGTAASSERVSNNSVIYVGDVANGTRTTIPQMSEVDIFSYRGSTYKSVMHKNANDTNGTGDVIRGVSLWRSTSAITSIEVSTGGVNYNSGTTISLYGIKAA